MKSAPSRETRSPSLLAGRAALCACFIWYCWEFLLPWPQNDDAYISYRYARNLVEGFGLVYNPGEYVEGYTNLLWTLLVAGGMALGLTGPMAGHVLGFLSGLFVLALTYLFARREIRNVWSWIATIPVLIVLTSQPFAAWTVTGMETPLFTAAILGAFASYAYARIGWMTFALAVAVLTRPDGVIAMAILLGFHMMESRKSDWRTWIPVAALGIVLLTVTIFRWVYYGSLVPNTFYAKVGGIPLIRGYAQVRSFLVLGSGLLMVPAGVALFRYRSARPAAVFTLAMVGYVISIGGDVFLYFRFLLPVLPLIAVLSVWGMNALWHENRAAAIALMPMIPMSISTYLFGMFAIPAAIASVPLGIAAAAIYQKRWLWTAPLVAASLVATVWSLVPNEFLDTLRPFTHTRKQLVITRKQHFATLSTNMQTRVDKLLQSKPTPTVIAAIQIGYLGYYSRLPLVDLLGLVTEEVAKSDERPTGNEAILILPGHQRSNSEYVLSRKPDYIFMGHNRSVLLPAEAALLQRAEFRQLYDWDPVIRAYKRRADEQ